MGIVSDPGLAPRATPPPTAGWSGVGRSLRRAAVPTTRSAVPGPTGRHWFDRSGAVPVSTFVLVRRRAWLLVVLLPWLARGRHAAR